MTEARYEGCDGLTGIADLGERNRAMLLSNAFLAAMVEGSQGKPVSTASLDNEPNAAAARACAEARFSDTCPAVRGSVVTEA